MTAHSLLDNISTEHRSALYYGKYEYKLSFSLEGAYWTRDKYTWKRYSEYRLGNRANQMFTAGYNHEKLERFYNWRESLDKNNKHSVRTEGWSLTIYANDVKILEEVIEVMTLDLASVNIVRAITSIPVGIKLFATQPTFRFRTYFKPSRVDADWRTSFLEFLSRYPSIVPCRGASNTDGDELRLVSQEFVVPPRAR